MPASARSTVLVIDPARGGVSINVWPAAVSTYGSSFFVVAARTAASSCAWVGSTTPLASGAETITSRFDVGNQSALSALTSASVTLGRNRRWKASSCQIVGSASDCRKLRVYSSARLDDSRSGLSVTVRS